MTAAPFVDPLFVPPEGLDTPDFRLRPLGPAHNVSDYAAWSSSIGSEPLKEQMAARQPAHRHERGVQHDCMALLYRVTL